MRHFTKIGPEIYRWYILKYEMHIIYYYSLKNIVFQLNRVLIDAEINSEHGQLIKSGLDERSRDCQNGLISEKSNG
jgi:hypothetical protein